MRSRCAVHRGRSQDYKRYRISKMSLHWMQFVMGLLFVAVWCLIGQIIVGQRKQPRARLYGAKNA